MVVGFNTASLISLLIGTVLPLIVGFVTKQSFNSGAKFFLLAVLSAATAVLTQYLAALNNNNPFDWRASILSALGTILVAVGTHYQLWKPSGVAARVQSAGPHDSPATAAVASDNRPVITDPPTV